MLQIEKKRKTYKKYDKDNYQTLLGKQMQNEKISNKIKN